MGSEHALGSSVVWELAFEDIAKHLGDRDSTVVMLPTFTDDDVERVIRLAPQLASSCAELMFVGPRAEEAHDCADDVLPSEACTTTFFVQVDAGCQHFVATANILYKTLIAVSNDEIHRALERELRATD